MRLLFVGHNLAGNAVGRTYALWLVARHLGHETAVLSVPGQSLWAPLRGTAFAEDVVDADLERHVAWTDVVIAVKPYPDSADAARKAAARQGTPFVLDVDDPDPEIVRSRLSRSSGHRRWSRTVREDRRLLAQMEALLAAAQGGVVITSNPELQRRYGGFVVPHVREVPALPVSDSPGTSPVVAFVGTPRLHKGVASLRRAVDELSGEGWTLTITADPPADARPWERWVGRTSLEEGQRIVATSDVVVVPSARGPIGDAQLPAKLIDAMMAGRAVVATDLAPIRWALAGTGTLIPDSSVEALRTALRALSDPSVRSALGARCRERAVTLASPAAAAPAFAAALDQALSAER